MLETLLLYALAELVLSMTPGPSVFLVIAQSIKQGFWSGVRVGMGIMVANTVFFILSMLGVGAVLATSPQLFNTMKIVGAAYLAYIALRSLWALRTSSEYNNTELNQAMKRSSHGDFTLGFVTNITNIKTIVIFVSIVPQFIDPTLNYTNQFLALGVVSTIVESPILVIYAYFSARFAMYIRNGGGQRYLDGASACVLLIIAGSLSWMTY